jgi:predicted ArsR family transcriptional regulator
MSSPRDDPALTSVSTLSDPVRAQLYDFVTSSREPVGRDEAAAAVGIGRAIAVYHLDKLVESGLLTASYRRPPGRSGPGAGRPAKRYARSGREFTVTVPPREYELAAHLLAQAVAADSGGASRGALRDAARQFGESAGAGHRAAAREAADAADAARVRGDAGRGEAGHSRAGAGSGDAGRDGGDASRGDAGRCDAGRDGGDAGRGDAGRGDAGRGDAGRGEGDAARGGRDTERLAAALRAHGFEPWSGADGSVALRNCPFHQLAARHRDIVCGMNLALIEGLVTGLSAEGMRPELDPRPGQCCVVIRAGRPLAETSTTGAR